MGGHGLLCIFSFVTPSKEEQKMDTRCQNKTIQIKNYFLLLDSHMTLFQTCFIVR